jgi:hypothetical protein
MGCYLILEQAIEIKSLIFELIERRVNREYWIFYRSRNQT